MMQFRQSLQKHFNRSIKIGAAQIQAIAGAIDTRGPTCNLLVFGCGYDSALWAELNAAGKTVFLETSPEWRERVLASAPDLDIRLYSPNKERTVQSSMENTNAAATERPPIGLSDHKWDVILVDGPEGWKPSSPGRAAEIAWALQLKAKDGHIFIDDYDRPLERKYADVLQAGGERIVIPNGNKKMLWISGRPDQLALGIELQNPPGDWLGRKGCVIFLLDRNYLPALKVFAYSIREALKETDRDIVVMTNDKMVEEDVFCNAVADRILFLDDEALAEMANIRRDGVRPEHYHQQFGKYTFLKFLCFDDLGYRDHVFLDVDMLCLDPRFRLDEIQRDADFAAAITVGEKRLGLSGLEYKPQELDHLGSEKRATALAKFESITVTHQQKITSFNSGVFFAGSRLLASRASSRLIDAASTFPFALEQRVSLAVLSETEGLNWANLPVTVNVPILPLYAIGRDHFHEVRRYVRILHYNGVRKPWQVQRHNADWLEKMWWDKHDAAQAWISSVESYGPRAVKTPAVRRLLNAARKNLFRSQG